MQITIMGCGNMGKGMAQRLAAHHKLFLYDRHFEKAEQLQQQGFGTAFKLLPEALRQSDALILAIKPQNLIEAAGLICAEINGKQPLIISLLAGTSLDHLRQHFSHHRILRLMPNLAMIYGEGVIGVTTDEDLSTKDKEQLTKLFEPLGKVYWLPENKMDAFTSLGGSGPAFVFVLIEAMVDAGIGMGFSAKESQEIVLQMMKGSLVLCEKTARHPGQLKWQVTSPGGTTIAGLRQMEQLGVRGAIIDTFYAAFERAKTISS